MADATTAADSVAARREARRRRILDSSHERLQRITGQLPPAPSPARSPRVLHSSHSSTCGEHQVLLCTFSCLEGWYDSRKRLLVILEYGVLFRYRNVSNWLHHVPAAAPGAASLRLQRLGRELYAVSPRPLAPRAPLTLAWEQNRPIASAEMVPGEERAAGDEWRCYECGEPCESAAQLELHLDTHDPPAAVTRKGTRGRRRRRPSVPQCSKCHQVFSRTFCLNRHMLSCSRRQHEPARPALLNPDEHTEVTTAALDDPPPSAVTEADGSHAAECAGEPGGAPAHSAACALCDTRRSSLSLYREHTESHRQPDGTFHCTHCAKRYPQYVCVRKHIRTYHAPHRRLPCPRGCPLAFPYRALLDAHLLTHTEVKEFACECGKAFKRKDKLARHVREKHPAPPAPPDGRGGEGVGVCGVENVKKHAFVCQLCQLTFRRGDMLRRHTSAAHPGSEAAAAQDYRSAARRTEHFLLLHPGEAPPPEEAGVRTREPAAEEAEPAHRCPAPGCDRRYRTRGKLLRHIRQKHVQEHTNESRSAAAYQNDVQIEAFLPPPPPPPPPRVEFDDCEAATAILFLAADEHTAFMYQQGQEMQAVTLELEEAGTCGDAAGYSAAPPGPPPLECAVGYPTGTTLQPPPPPPPPYPRRHNYMDNPDMPDAM